jgi:hypothetical protein
MVDSVSITAFPYMPEPDAAGRLVFRPYVRIHLQAADETWHLFEPFPDAGADLTLLREDDCEKLGYPPTAGQEGSIRGVCSGSTPIYIHTLRMRLGTEEFNCRVAFAVGAQVPRRLGRQGVFQQFKVCYDDVRQVIEFITR